MSDVVGGSVQERVGTERDAAIAGAAWLDEHVPGWHERGRICVQTLNVMSTRDCVLGQLYGCWSQAGAAVDLFREQGLTGAQLGFICTPVRSSVLTEAWVEQIQTRRAIDALRPAS